VKISALRNLFHSQLSPLYEQREIDAIFFFYTENKYDIEKYHYFLNLEREIVFEETDIKALAEGTPIQYVTGKTTFCELELNVNSSVLIPRPETEELVNLILEVQGSKFKVQSPKFINRWLKPTDSMLKILDIGTGSGAIAIALAKNIENAEVWATDISKEVLETAQKNAANCDVKITCIHHDILKYDTSLLPDNLDIIVSNPPYIPCSERDNLHKNVVDYEPSSALFVPDENPLVFYDAIAKVAKKNLRKGGVLYFETHEQFHSELSIMLAELNFQDIKLWNDLNDKPRFVSCKKL
jgi:release factor glutamine methyltransferase